MEEEVTILEREQEDLNLDVVSVESYDSMWSRLQKYGSTNPKFHSSENPRPWEKASIDEDNTEIGEDISKEELSEDSVDCVIISDTDSSDFDRMSRRVQKWIGDRIVVIGLPATIIPMDEPSNGDSRPRSNLASLEIVHK